MFNKLKFTNIFLLCSFCSILSQSKSQTNFATIVPFPQQIVIYPSVLTINSFEFKFITKTIGKCDLLEKAIERYKKLIFIKDCSQLNTNQNSDEIFEDFSSDFEFSDLDSSVSETTLTNLTIEVKQKCDNLWPELDMDEMYVLRVNSQDFPNEAFLFSNSIWGALRGLETFSQLIHHKSDNYFTINSTLIIDYPRFSHRGLLIDTSRHYLPIHTILENLDAMSYHKLNVLHWHIVDDQSFPYVSESFPELSSKGSYNPKTHVYNSDDIETVVEYARLRGIRVLIEFDTPGHTRSWGKGYPSLLTECYSGDKPLGIFGPLNPSRNSTFDFLESLLSEIVDTFREQYLHLGGDEVNYLCWITNPEIKRFMKSIGIVGNYIKLEEYYWKRLLDIVLKLDKKFIVWQEVFDKSIDIPNNTVINVWKSDYNPEVYKLTELGFRVIHSSCWYLNNITYGYDWYKSYSCDPFSFNGTQQQNQLVIGGEASMWGEWVDASNFMSRTWPRSVAVAERLWSSQSITNTTEAKYRFVPNRCRMLERGLRFEPMVEPTEHNFGFCKCDYNV